MRLGLWGIKLATLALAIGGCGGAQGHEGVANMTVCYIPIGVETLTPITPHSNYIDQYSRARETLRNPQHWRHRQD